MNIIDQADILDDGSIAVCLKWFRFRQNNSGGYFISDDMVCEEVFIQDVSAEHAVIRANAIFADRSEYCECCGERWSTEYVSDDDGTVEPECYGVSIYQTARGYFQNEARLHYFDGRVVAYRFGDSCPDGVELLSFTAK